MSFVSLNIEYFPDPTRGVPVYKGYVYVGEPDTDPEVPGNQVQVTLRLSDGSTIAAIQPIITGAGGVALHNGSPVQLLVGQNYSLKVLDKHQSEVYYVANAFGIAAKDPVFGAGLLLVGLKTLSILSDGVIAITTGRTSFGDQGGGLWVWDSSDLSSEVSSDPLSGLYAAPLSSPSGSSGAWVRQNAAQANVKWFGAVGDGVTDDTPAINAALSLHGFVIVPPGVYVCEGLDIVDSQLVGTGGSLLLKPGTSTYLLRLQGASKLLNLKCDGNASNQLVDASSVLTLIAPDYEISGCVFTKFRYKVVSTDVANSPRGLIHNNTFLDNGTVVSCSQIETRSPYANITNNTFKTIGDGHCIRTGLLTGDPTTTKVTGTLISGNSFKDTQHVGVTIEIYSENTSICDNVFDNTEASIKTEPLNTNHTLISNNNISNSTIPTGLNLSSTNVTFVDNVVMNMPCALDIGDNGVIHNNVFNNVGVATLYASINQSGAFSDVDIKGNVIKNAPYRGISVVGGGLSIVENNSLHTIAAEGIRVDGNTPVIKGNTVDGCTYGVSFVSTCTDFVCNDNVIINETSGKITFVNNSSSLGSTIKDNPGYAPTTPSVSIIAGELTVPNWATEVKVAGEGAVADDLTNILGRSFGDLLMIRTATATYTITVKDGTLIRAAGDFAMTTSSHTMLLILTSIGWLEVSRSINA